MLIRPLCFSGLIALFASTSAFANNYGQSAPAYSAQMGGRHADHMRLPLELKIMWHHEEHARLKGMPKEQRHGWLKRQWIAMTPTQKDRKIAELQARWNALPKDVRQMMLDKKQQKHEARRIQYSEQSGGGRAENRSMQQ
jgi:hypothetical protein